MIKKHIFILKTMLFKLGYNKEIVVLRGKQPYILDKFIYIEHPFARNLKEVLLTDYKTMQEESPKIPPVEVQEVITQDETQEEFYRF